MPMPLTMVPRDQAHTRMKGTEISSAMPSTYVSKALMGVNSLVATPMMPAPMPPPKKPTQMARVMLALRKDSTRPLFTISPDQKMVANREPNRQTMGTMKFHMVSL